MSPGTITAARSLCRRASDIARLLPGGRAFAVLAREERLPPSPLDAYRSAAGTDRQCYWWQDAWMLASGSCYESKADGPGRAFHLAEASTQLRTACVSAYHGGGPDPQLPVTLLRVGFEDRAPGPSHWGAQLPGARLVLPRRLLWRRRSGHGYVVDAIVVGADDDPDALAERLIDEPVSTRELEPSAPWPALDAAPYPDLVEDAVALLEHGAMRKVVLARAIDRRLERPIEVPAVLERLHAASDDWTYCYAIDLDDGAVFAGATPELLYHLDGSECRTIALAGSRPRGTDADADAELGEQLLRSTKERKEHQLVVEHIVRQLRARSGDLEVPGSPTLRRLARLQHLETQLVCHLDRPDAFDLLGALHPTPAVAGLPVDLATDFIRRRERLHRGLYTGVLGYATPAGARMVVPLRGGVLRGNDARLFAGAGIVETSQPAAEMAETELKLRPMLAALGSN